MSDSFDADNRSDIAALGRDAELRRKSLDWVVQSARHRYSYHFRWLGVPIIQYPQDVMTMQELIWEVRPDLVIETGVARGGSLIFYASLLALLGGEGRVIGVDVEIRPANRETVERHPLAKRITLIEGSSTSPDIVRRVTEMAAGRRALVVLDSNHTHEHVLRELQLYSPLVTKGSYLVVFDTIVEDMPADSFPDRPWGRGNNPKTAVWEFLKTNPRFAVDKDIENKLLITVAPDGYLKCISD